MSQKINKRVFWIVFFSVLLISELKSQTIDTSFVDGTVYIKVHASSNIILDPYNYSISGLNQVINEYGITEIIRPFKTPDISLQKIYRIKFTKWTKINHLIADLMKLGFLEYAEKAPLYRVNHIPNDYTAAYQWSLAKIKAPQAWDFSTGSSSVSVAIVDNGVALNHVDLLLNIHINSGEIPGNSLDEDLNGYPDDIRGYDVADNDNDPAPPAGTNNSSYFVHGTVCAGIASAATNNGVGISSIGYSVKIIPVKCAPDNSDGSQLTNSYEGVDYAMSAGADIVSMSFGSSSTFLTWSFLISAAHARNIVLIASAGNNNSEQIYYPAGYPYVIAAGATTQTDERASFSNHGSWVDVMSPGVSILSTFPQDNNTYGYANGTSMSCPLVAGLAGLILSLDPTIFSSEVETFIKNGCDNIDAMNPGYIGKLGSGRINAYRSLNAMAAINVEETENNSNPNMLIYPNPADGSFNIRFGENVPYTCDLKIYNAKGQLIYSRALLDAGILQNRIVSIGNLAAGEYFVYLSNGKWMETQTIIIR